MSIENRSIFQISGYKGIYGLLCTVLKSLNVFFRSFNNFSSILFQSFHLALLRLLIHNEAIGLFESSSIIRNLLEFSLIGIPSLAKKPLDFFLVQFYKFHDHYAL